MFLGAGDKNKARVTFRDDDVSSSVVDAKRLSQRFHDISVHGRG